MCLWISLIVSGLVDWTPNLKLNQPRAHLSDKFQFLLIEDIRGDLEMEVCDPIVMFHEITPDS